MHDAKAVPAGFRLSAANIRAIDARLTALRDDLFEQDYLFASPWRLLLDIERATFSGTAFPDTGTGGLPASTARRYLAMFERDGLIERRVDPQGEGRELVVLTASGKAKLNAIFEQVALAFNV